jgi:hypothetical protein
LLAGTNHLAAFGGKTALHYDALPINFVVDDGEFLVFQIVSDGGTVVTATLGIN